MFNILHNVCHIRQYQQATSQLLPIGGKATFINAELFETDFSQTSVIAMFLPTEINLKLRPKILALEGKVRGEEITFAAGGRAYRSKMNGKSLELR